MHAVLDVAAKARISNRGLEFRIEWHQACKLKIIPVPCRLI